MKTKNISEFIFNKAVYDLADDKGNSVQLVINYKNRSFEVLSSLTRKRLTEKFKNEVKNLACILIKRKSGVNFAESN